MDLKPVKKHFNRLNSTFYIYALFGKGEVFIYRQIYIYIRFLQFHYSLCVSDRMGNNCFASRFYFVLVSANLASSVSSNISVAGLMVPSLFKSAYTNPYFTDKQVILLLSSLLGELYVT